MDILKLAKSVIAGAGSKLSNDWKKQVAEVSTPQGRQAYQDKNIKFALDNAMMSGGVKAVQPTAQIIKRLATSAAESQRDNIAAIAARALKNPSNFSDINHWGIADEIVGKIFKGKDTPDELRQLTELLQLNTLK